MRIRWLGRQTLRGKGVAAASLSLLALVATSGCDPSVPPEEDAGRAPIDAVVPDPVPPRIRSTTPTAGDLDIERTQALTIRFTEPMDPTVGRVDVPGERSLTVADGEWDEAGSAITLFPAVPWPSGEVTIQITTEFADPSGNPLEEEFELTFTTLDDIRPTATASEPEEGATALSARIEMFRFTFDEEMDRTVGGIDVLGGAGTVGERTWSEDRRTVTFAIADLEYDREYDIQLRDFRDRNGNRLDGTPYLGDGVLDFTTGPDVDAPVVTRSEPTEAQVDVNPAVARFVLVTFDEPMDDSVTTFALTSGGASVDVTGEWTSADRVLRIDVQNVLEFDSIYSLDLSGLQDRAGNTLAPEPYLIDGRLDFTVSSDAFAPFVRSSTPNEDGADVDYLEATRITLELSEAMDTAITDVTLRGGPVDLVLTGTWMDATHVEFDVTDRLIAGTSYTLDLRVLEDTTGNPLDTTHSYLRDGQLDFVTGPPAGESCRDPLTMAQATVTSGVHSWTVAPGQFLEREGGTQACAGPSGTRGPDAVIRFDKTSADLANGGELLRVRVDADNNSADFDVAIISGAACDPDAAPARCVADSILSTTYADVPAGPVWIWVARRLDSTSNGFTISVEETAAPRPEGEACDAPYSTSSAIYTAPAAAGEAHVWNVPENLTSSMDISDVTTFDGSVVSCDPDSGHGVDAVVRYAKQSAESILRIALTPTGSSSHTDVNVEVFSGCDANDGGVTRYGCAGPVGLEGGELLVDAPAGDLFFWMTAANTSPSRSSSTFRRFPATALEITEVPDVTAGEVCTRALTLTSPSTAVTGASDQRFGAPGCFEAASDVEWYRITTSEPVLIVQGDAPGGVGLVDVASGDTIACSDDAQARPVARFLPPGSDVCVAVEMGRSISSLSVTELAYSGVGASPGVPLNIGRPLTASGNEDSITGDLWMSVGAGTLFMYYSTSPEALDAPITGNERAAYRNSADGLRSTQFGQAGLFVGGQLFSLDNTASPTANRVYRIWDGTSPVYAPTAWDVTPNYHNEDIAAATAVGDSIFFVTEGLVPRFYSIDTSSPSTAVLMGTNERIDSGVGLSADDTSRYFAGQHVDTNEEGVWRLPRASLSDPMFLPDNLTPGIDFVHSSSPTREVAMYVDRETAPGALYIRNAQGHVEAILDPGSTPLYIGEIVSVGTSADAAMGFDPVTGSIYLFETESDSSGAFVRFDSP